MVHRMEHLPYKDRQRADVVQLGEEKALREPDSGLSVSLGSFYGVFYGEGGEALEQVT